MKRIIVALALLPIFATAQNLSPDNGNKGKAFKLTGKSSNLAYTIDWVFLQYSTGGEWKTDSVKAENGSYKFTGVIDEASMSRLRVNYVETEPGKKVKMVTKRDMAMVYIQPGKISVTSVDSFSNVKVKGSAIHTEYTKLMAQAKPYDDKVGPLYVLYSQFSKAKEKNAAEKVYAVIDSLGELKKENVYAEYVKKNPASPLAIFALEQYAGWDIKASKVEPLFNGLSESNKSLPSAIDFKEKLEIAKKTGVGEFAMNFTQNDTAGVPVTLASLKGRYLLIDFWASWCGPCRAENPNLVKVFDKYKGKGFHILGVSLDRPGQKDKWMKAIYDDKLDWTQVSDLQFWDNEVVKQYGIVAIPQNLLLDPEGRIIAKNIRGEELELKVAEAIEGKKAF